jgi:hypothetical protein
MVAPQGRTNRTSLTQEHLNWRKIYAFSCLYVLAILAYWYTAMTSHQLNRQLPLPRSTVNGMRPKLFETLPSQSTVNKSARIIDPSLFLGLEGLYQGISAASGNKTMGQHTGSGNYLQDMKNPCWRSENDIVCLPYFYVLGSFQSGIRDMQVKMHRHPQIARTATAEPHFWSENRPTSRYLESLSVATDTLLKNPGRSVIGYVS